VYRDSLPTHGWTRAVGIVILSQSKTCYSDLSGVILIATNFLVSKMEDNVGLAFSDNIKKYVLELFSIGDLRGSQTRAIQELIYGRS
jgi:hypothetical protein